MKGGGNIGIFDSCGIIQINCILYVCIPTNIHNTFWTIRCCKVDAISISGRRITRYLTTGQVQCWTASHIDGPATGCLVPRNAAGSHVTNSSSKIYPSSSVGMRISTFQNFTCTAISDDSTIYIYDTVCIAKYTSSCIKVV